jgi:hypothetical protein
LLDMYFLMTEITNLTSNFTQRKECFLLTGWCQRCWALMDDLPASGSQGSAAVLGLHVGLTDRYYSLSPTTTNTFSATFFFCVCWILRPMRILWLEEKLAGFENAISRHLFRKYFFCSFFPSSLLFASHCHFYYSTTINERTNERTNKRTNER